MRTHGPRVRWIRDEDVVMIAVVLTVVVVGLVLLLFGFKALA